MTEEPLRAVREDARNPHFPADAVEREQRERDGEDRAGNNHPEYGNPAHAAHHDLFDSGFIHIFESHRIL